MMISDEVPLSTCAAQGSRIYFDARKILQCIQLFSVQKMFFEWGGRTEEFDQMHRIPKNATGWFRNPESRPYWSCLKLSEAEPRKLAALLRCFLMFTAMVWLMDSNIVLYQLRLQFTLCSELGRLSSHVGPPSENFRRHLWDGDDPWWSVNFPTLSNLFQAAFSTGLFGLCLKMPAKVWSPELSRCLALAGAEATSMSLGWVTLEVGSSTKPTRSNQISRAKVTQWARKIQDVTIYRLPGINVLKNIQVYPSIGIRFIQHKACFANWSCWSHMIMLLNVVYPKP